MKKRLLCFGLFLVTSGVFPQIDEHVFNGELALPVEMGYVLYTPDGYENSQKEYPLIVFLHGAGERGTDLSQVAVHGPLKYVREGNKLEAVIVAPQCAKDDYWEPDKVAALVKKVIAENKIDANRVYLTGLSMGGYGVWAVGVEHPGLFAAMLPVCGPMYRPAYANITKLKKMPIWVFHGALDEVVPLENSSKMVKRLRSVGNEVKYTIYPFANHDSWTKTYNNPNVYSWLLKQQKQKQ